MGRDPDGSIVFIQSLSSLSVLYTSATVNTGDPLAVVDVDTRNGGDVEKVRALLAEYKVRIFAEVDTPSGGKYFYIAGHSAWRQSLLTSAIRMAQSTAHCRCGR